MKKFTFMLLAALIAVASWAGVPTKGLQVTKAMPLSYQKMTSAKQLAPTKKAATYQVQAPVTSKFAKMAQKAKAGAKKAPKKAGLADLLAMDWMLCSEYYEYDSEAGTLVGATPAAGGTSISFSMVDAQTVSIEGFISGATEAIQATFAMTTDEELLAAGVVAEISIPDGQTLLVNDTYGPVILRNVSGEEGDPITAYVLSNGAVMFNGIWTDLIGGDGEYAGYMWSGYYYFSFALPVNGTMEVETTDGDAASLPIVIVQDEPKTATIYNFAGFETAVEVSMKENNTFVIEDQPLFYYDSTYGYFYVGGLLISGGNYYLDTLTGVGTENTLTFDGNWMVYSPTKGSIYELYEPATITLTTGEFEYPVIPDVAATPADPEILEVGNYDSEEGYGYVAFTIPTTDIDGNDLKESELYYQLYSDINGDIQPITFTTDLYIKISEDMSIIPYTFTDNYDFADKGSYKIVFLNYNFNTMYDRIGVKSIYTGGGETNESEIVWAEVEKEETTAEYTFDFNKMDVAVSSSVTTDGDITEDKSFTEGDVKLTISPKDEKCGTENRFWSTSDGPQLRVYSGTLTFEVPTGLVITSMVFNYNKTSWGNNNGEVVADSGDITNDATNHQATWTGEAQNVVFAFGHFDEENNKWISGNSQINSITVTVEAEGDEPIEPGEGYLFSFEDGTLGDWTTIDADGDGYTWIIGAAPSINTHDDGSYSVYSQSYASNALTPDNYLVSPKIKLDGKISFYACAQDGDWPEEHFAVAVSTAGNTDAADFTNVQEWTMTAAPSVDQPANSRGMFRSPKKTPGNWYLYTVDLSSYEGAEGYVAIRHFDCTDMFYIVVDDITLETSKIILPDYTITPAEGVVKSLNEFEITFNNYEVGLLMEAVATLKNETTNNEWNTSTFQLYDGKLSFSFAEEDITEPGEYTLTITGVQDADDNDIELSFAYTIKAKPEVVVLPEGVEPETWYFSTTASQSNIRNQEVAVAIDGSDIYIQGLNVDYLPEAWVKGTIEGNTATFPSGQYFGAFEYSGVDYDMFFVGYDSESEEIDDVVFDFDAEAGTLTTDTWIVISAYADEVSYYEYYKGAKITREMPVAPELVTLPEGVETEDWTIDGTFADNYGSDNIVRATEVAFDGTDIYVKGIPFYFEDAWMKGTIDAESGIATFPTGQFVGEDEYGWEFMVGSDDFETLCDIEFAYDAEAKTLTQLTNYIVENGDTPDEIAAYGYWADMFIYAGEPVIVEPVEAPEGLETESYLFTATCLENGEEDAVEYSSQMQVGFDGKDVYFKGVSDDTSNMWLKGTLSEDGKTVTIPANQYMGQATILWYSFDYYFTAVAEDGETMEDIVLNYDAENNKFTTDQTLVLHDGKRSLGEPYQTFTNVVITKMVEFAATPADPSIDGFKLTDTTYPKAYFVIPAEDVDGNALLTAKLFYTVWYMEEGSEEMKQFTAVAGEDVYSKLPNDMTEIPYDYDDNWDIYKGGATFYFNPVEVVATWTKFGIQSIYYGGGERNVSNIVWSDDTITTGIANVKAENGKNVVIFDLQGRRVAAPAKGLYIMNGKKVVVK